MRIIMVYDNNNIICAYHDACRARGCDVGDGGAGDDGGDDDGGDGGGSRHLLTPSESLSL